MGGLLGPTPRGPHTPGWLLDEHAVQRPPVASATAAPIHRASGLTAEPATKTVGVTSTPSAVGRAVT